MTSAEKLEAFWETWAPIIPATCACGEPLDHEEERDAGCCWNCLAEAAGHEMPEPKTETLLTRAQIEDLCGVTHRRKAS